MTSTKTIHVHYVAMLREHTGMKQEDVTTDALDAGELYTEISQRHEFPWSTRQLRPAINDSLTTWNHKLHHNDRIIFLPPSSGG